ncbi:MAG: hypothetical protein AAF565_03660 [Pseudomonadota bacterium]
MDDAESASRRWTATGLAALTVTTIAGLIALDVTLSVLGLSKAAPVIEAPRPDPAPAPGPAPTPEPPAPAPDPAPSPETKPKPVPGPEAQQWPHPKPRPRPGPVPRPSPGPSENCTAMPGGLLVCDARAHP